jgi:type VI protein secretion system component VasK
MPNNLPIYSKIADVQWSTSAATANTTFDLTSGTIYPCFSADTTNGGYIQRIRFRTLGTNLATTVARVWINNGLTTTNVANNTLWDEITLPATTVSQTAAQANYELPMNLALPPSYRLYITLGTAPNAAGWSATVIGGKY